jgi:hypothetical protein
MNFFSLLFITIVYSGKKSFEEILFNQIDTNIVSIKKLYSSLLKYLDLELDLFNKILFSSN